MGQCNKEGATSRALGCVGCCDALGAVKNWVPQCIGCCKALGAAVSCVLQRIGCCDELGACLDELGAVMNRVPQRIGCCDASGTAITWALHYTGCCNTLGCTGRTPAAGAWPVAGGAVTGRPPRRHGCLHRHGRPHPQGAAAEPQGRGEPAGDGQVPLRCLGQGEPPGPDPGSCGMGAARHKVAGRRPSSTGAEIGHGRASGAGSRPVPGRRARARPCGNRGAGRGCPAMGARIPPPFFSWGYFAEKKGFFLLNCKPWFPPFTPSLQGILVTVQKLLAFLSLPKNGLKKG